MSVESFLHFWSHYNTRIIEILVGLILLCLVYLAYRTFLAPVGGDEETAMGSSRRDDLEKTLTKILETQKVGAGPQLSDGEAAAEIARLRAEITEKDKQIAELKSRPESVEAVPAPAAAAAPGLSAEEKARLEGTIRDLEARLAEYEIISEDIADLSFYKEENARLQKELEALKGGASAEAAPVPEAIPTPEPAQPVAALEPEVAPVASEPTPLAADPLLAEMAAAAQASEPAATSDDSQLMNQFENFVKKG